VHAALAFTVFQTLTGADDGRQSWLARALAQPGGRWLFVAFGLGMAGVGLFHLWRAFSGSFVKKLEQSEMDATERKWAIRLGRLGLAARGIVFPIIGWFFVRAGLDTDLSKAEGTAGALREIARAPLGSMLLPVVAAGLIAYAALLVLNARYRRPFV
jgi:NADH:ubiquinone oxidoreductase subunit 5 (subunit L)/multisubunit Na+/H+ antiporter MnhA subunit